MSRLIGGGKASKHKHKYPCRESRRVKGESDPQKERDNTANSHQVSCDVKAKNGQAMQTDEGF